MNQRVHVGAVEPFRADLLHRDKSQALKVLEEAAEVVEAFKDWNKHGQTAEQRHDLIDECADVIQATVNLMARWSSPTMRFIRPSRIVGRGMTHVVAWHRTPVTENITDTQSSGRISRWNDVRHRICSSYTIQTR